MTRSDSLYFSGGTVLTGSTLVETSVCVEDGRIAALGGNKPPSAQEIDITGLHLLPGIIDVHGDAFERQISPRPGVRFPLDLAMHETDRQLAANGITTAYHGLTLSWEPGLRSIESGDVFLDQFEKMQADFSIDHRIQLRWETYAFEGVDLVKSWLGHESQPALAFNDHTTATLRKFHAGERPRKANEWASRAEMDTDDYVELVLSLADREKDVPAKVAALADLAREMKTPMLSHDDRSLADRRAFRLLGANVAEFPLVEVAASDARANGEHVVLGAPNVVRGGSHVGALGAEEAVNNGLCSVLASDYYYPAMLRSAGILAQNMGLAHAWACVSSNAAAAMNLEDRGRIAAGLRADIVLMRLEPPNITPVATYCAGHPVWRGRSARN